MKLTIKNWIYFLFPIVLISTLIFSLYLINTITVQVNDQENFNPKASDGPPQYLNSVSLTWGTHVSGTVEDTHLDDGNYMTFQSYPPLPGSSNYVISLMLNFYPLPPSYMYKFSAHISSDTLITFYINGETFSSSNIEITDYMFGPSDFFMFTINGQTPDGYFNIYIDYLQINRVYYLQPSADFEANSTLIEAGESVSFTFLGSEGDDPADFTWDFGDETPTSNLKNPTHQYNESGVYDVSLRVSDMGGETSTLIWNDYIKVNEDLDPFADFTANATTIKVGECVAFKFTGSEGNTPSNLSWDFGDGSPLSFDTNPVHDYHETGIYNVSLVIIDEDKEYSVEVKYNYISVISPDETEVDSDDDPNSGEELFPNDSSVLTIIIIVIGISVAVAGIASIMIVRKKIK